MTTPLDDLFAKVRSENRAALIGYLPAGFPTQQGCIDALTAMVEGGVDAVEIGFPYSDPVMDGPVIQAAADTSLRNGTGAKEVFATIDAISKLAPTVVMTYWNPIERYGVNNFLSDLKKYGGSGVVTPDLTIEESTQWITSSNLHETNRIYVVAPSTSEDRLRAVTKATSGFVYAASLMGVTGTRTSVSSTARELVARLRGVTNLPIAVGLGVSTPEQAHEVAQYADGVIVGSAFIRLLQESKTADEGLAHVRSLAHELSKGLTKV
ncbi:MAG: tryptophan synthase subunit alpha [Actinomycetota bacterium]